MILRVTRGITAIACVAFVALAAPALAQRDTVSLDGVWNISEGSMEAPFSPEIKTATVPVPGLVDMAEPAFEQVGTTSTRRDAFWYERAFSLPGEVPARAILKINKAAYNTRVFMNGKLVGDHVGAFTPGYFDVQTFLKGNGQRNVIGVRVGADLEKLPKDVPNGSDFEKKKYQPGIYDSVNLILSGRPSIEQLQIVPDITNSTARVVVNLAGEEDTSGTLDCVIREVVSKREVARIRQPFRMDGGTSTSLDVSLRIQNARQWSPEDPFLYTLELSTGADNVDTRFAMRSFSFDRESGRAMLNGNPYIMRGTNVCIFRFFEDSQRGNLPWDREWVSRLHSSFRDMHWNSIRYCIGFPPEFWYDIADEQGFLIQDEFPIWSGGRGWPQFVTPESVAQQYREWLPEHWNHASVVIWDAQNESITTVTGAAVQAVRHMDLSNRPWDNGWASPVSETDSYESHPYVFNNPTARLSTLSTLPKEFRGSPVKYEGNPMIINEYGWLWLQRNGEACKLTEKLYQNLLGNNATNEERRELYARYLAALTEYWRATRGFAGVLHFCGLSYSRPGGETSDNFIDVAKLQYEPRFYKYVRDSFSTAGVCVDFYEEELLQPRKLTIPVSVVNDWPHALNGSVGFTLRSGTKEVFAAEETFAAEALGKATVDFDVPMPTAKGKYQLAAELRTKGQSPVRSLRDIDIITSAQLGIALDKASSASTELEKGGTLFSASNAFDGRKNTRWSSEFSDKQWIAVDLGERQKVTSIELIWEAACARNYVLEVSDDGISWDVIHRSRRTKGGTEKVRFQPVVARYVRMKGLERATKFGYSLWEFRVFGEEQLED